MAVDYTNTIYLYNTSVDSFFGTDCLALDYVDGANPTPGEISKLSFTDAYSFTSPPQDHIFVPGTTTIDPILYALSSSPNSSGTWHQHLSYRVGLFETADWTNRLRIKIQGDVGGLLDCEVYYRVWKFSSSVNTLLSPPDLAMSDWQITAPFNFAGAPIDTWANNIFTPASYTLEDERVMVEYMLRIMNIVVNPRQRIDVIIFADHTIPNTDTNLETGHFMEHYWMPEEKE